MKNCLWYPIDAFHSLHEYARFCNWLQLQIAEGMVEEITVTENSTRLPLYQRRTFICKLTGEEWQLIAPDFPFKGTWLLHF